LLDRPWTPGDADQAEDRVRRIGQTHPVKSIWISAFEIDDSIDTMLKQKSATTSAVLVDETKGSGKDVTRGTDSCEAPKLSIFQMLKSLFPSGKSKMDGCERSMVQTTLPFSQSKVTSPS
jgi:hypothetical protein